jgi:4-hydroxy-tetrahydrodipicolinate reductase
MKIGIVGCAGRMGRMLGAVALETDGAQLAGGTEAPGSPFIGQDIAVLAGGEPSGLRVGDDAAELFASVDAVIDFTIPAATIAHAALAAAHNTAMIIGTTGLDDADMAKIAEAATKTAIVHAGNMSLGVNLLVGLAEQVAAALGADFDIEVLEMHHKHKIDAPSGTALMLGKAAAEGRGLDHDASAVMSREGHTGVRPDDAIGYATLRGGDVVGDHTVMFVGPGERVELTHKAADRGIFARGAIRAAMWTEGRVPGLYSMRDVLGLTT